VSGSSQLPATAFLLALHFRGNSWATAALGALFCFGALYGSVALWDVVTDPKNERHRLTGQKMDEDQE